MSEELSQFSEAVKSITEILEEENNQSYADLSSTNDTINNGIYYGGLVSNEIQNFCRKRLYCENKEIYNICYLCNLEYDLCYFCKKCTNQYCEKCFKKLNKKCLCKLINKK